MSIFRLLVDFIHIMNLTAPFLQGFQCTMFAQEYYMNELNRFKELEEELTSVLRRSSLPWTLQLIT